MCTLGECLCTGLCGTLDHGDPSSFLVEGEHPTPTLGLRRDWLCRGSDLPPARQCRVASRAANSLTDWYWAFNAEPACPAIWSAGKPSRPTVDEYSYSRCRQLLDSLHRLLATFTVGLVRLAFVVWPVGSNCRHCNHWGVSIDSCFPARCFPIQPIALGCFAGIFLLAGNPLCFGFGWHCLDRW